jgi:hypothetical protein
LEPVDVRDEGRRRLYRLIGRELKPIHDWVKSYERSWTERLDSLELVAMTSSGTATVTLARDEQILITREFRTRPGSDPGLTSLTERRHRPALKLPG